MQKLLQKWFGQEGRLDADMEAANAVANVDKTDVDKNESGATAIEYGLIAALVAVAVVGALTAMGTDLEATFDEVSTQLQ